MRKATKQFFQKSACGILCAAMVLTSLSVPGRTAYAAEPDMLEAAEMAEEEISSAEEYFSEETNEQQEEFMTEELSSVEMEENTDEEDLDEDGSGESEDAIVEDLDGSIDEEENIDAETEVLEEDGTDAEQDEEIGVFAARNGSYNDVTVNLYFYAGNLSSEENVGFYKWSNDGGNITITDTSANPSLTDWGVWAKGDVYRMNAVNGHPGWYSITVKITDTIDDAKSVAGFALYNSSAVEATSTGLAENAVEALFKCSGYAEGYPEIYSGLLSGEITAVKDGKGYASIEDAEVSTEALAALVAEAEKLNEEDYKALGWKTFSDALKVAQGVLQKDQPSSSEVQEAFDNLTSAKEALVSASAIMADVNVKPVELADDFITGADVSSYWSLKESGTVFKDEEGNPLSDEGFFKYLHDGGTNWIRIRVWNDPYDSDSHGYGGGNNDLDKAIKMGKLATNAGMRVLIDFHYSDFWADPSKQQAPKAWAKMTVDEKAEAVYQFTKDSLAALKSAGVDVGMVQVGNETTNGICGVFYNTDGWAAAAKIYNAGSKAVREFDENCLVAVHFTNPETAGKYASLAKSLNDNNVDYDVFASSYYPFWHGTTENLTSVLANVAKTYGKKVMVAETSWATTLEDQDGHANTVRVGNNDSDNAYAFSVQGQADEIRAVVDAANNVNKVDGVAAGSSIGVFYWESAWMSPYYVYDEDGFIDDELYNENKKLWEQWGSGWASSFGGEYDPEDAGKWFGGSAVDNQSWFGFDGKALPTAKIYNYIRTGVIAEKAVSEVVNPAVTIDAGAVVDYPEKVTVKFNDGTSEEYAVVWDKESQDLVDTREPGDHKVKGTVTCDYSLSDGSTVTETKKVTFTITVTMPNLLANPSFEEDGMGHKGWDVAGDGITSGKDNEKNWTENPKSGTYAMHFYNAKAVTFTTTQKVTGLKAGTYVFGGYIQGEKADVNAIVTIYDKNDSVKGDVLKAACSLEGWRNWKNPEIAGITISDGDYLVVGMTGDVQAGGWGSMDDFYLYQAFEYDVLVDDAITNGTVTCSPAKSVGGQTITITASPSEGYRIAELRISGRSVKEGILESEHGSVTNKANTAILTYHDKVTDTVVESFTMPNSKVTVSAIFRVDTAALDALITEYEGKTQGNYTDESWQVFVGALEAAKKAAENQDVTQTELDNAKTALEAAVAGLTTNLEALIKECEKVEDQSANYTPKSWEAFKTALDAARTTAGKENATQEEIDAAVADLKEAYDTLVKKADYSGLNSKIDEYKDLVQGEYSDVSWAAFKKALEDAKTVAANENASQSDVDAALEALDDAHLGLRKEGEITDFSALEELLTEYKAIWEQGQGNYTDESWAVFTKAWNYAEGVAKNENAAQAQVDKAVQDLTNARTGLEEKEPSPEEDVTVTFHYPDGTTSTERLKKNTKLTKPESEGEDEAGKYVINWYIDEAKTELYDFDTVVTGDLALYGSKNYDQSSDDGKVTVTLYYPTGHPDGTMQTITLEKNAKLTNPGYEGLDSNGKYGIIWYADEAKTETYDFDTPVSEDISLYGSYYYYYEETGKDETGAEIVTPTGIWVERIDDVEYTGSAIKPAVIVYDGTRRLTEKVDYKVKYSDNKKVSTAEKPAKVTITPCGNYEKASKFSINFNITPRVLTEENVTLNYKPEMNVKYNSKKEVVGQTQKISLKYGKVTVPAKEYTVTYMKGGEKVEKLTEEGTYQLVIKTNDKSSFKGELSYDIVMTDKILMSALKIKVAAQNYTGEALEPDVSVTYKGKNVETLAGKKLGEIFDIVYKDNINAGTASVTLTAKEDTEQNKDDEYKYYGSRTVNFKINGTAIKKAAIDGFQSTLPYTGEKVTQKVTLVLNKGKGNERKLQEGKDYEIEHFNHTNAGKATMIITGIGEFSGSVKKTFTVGKINLKQAGTDTKVEFVGTAQPLKVAQDKSGAKPEIQVTYKNNVLVQDKDYKVTYSGNKAVGSNAKVTVKGIGNYTGDLKNILGFEIEPKNIGDASITVDAADLKYAANGRYKAKLTVYDNGVKLSSKEYSAGQISEVTVNEDTQCGTAEVTLTGKGNYVGTKTVTIQIKKALVSSARVNVKGTYYYANGDAVSPKPEDLEVTITSGGNKITLKAGEDFEIESCTNNTKQGKATVIIRGKGEYGGTKSVKYKILPKWMRR